jgi:hypothetical protein
MDTNRWVMQFAKLFPPDTAVRVRLRADAPTLTFSPARRGQRVSVISWRFQQKYATKSNSAFLKAPWMLLNAPQVKTNVLPVVGLSDKRRQQLFDDDGGANGNEERDHLPRRCQFKLAEQGFRYPH